MPVTLVRNNFVEVSTRLPMCPADTVRAAVSGANSPNVHTAHNIVTATLTRIARSEELLMVLPHFVFVVLDFI